MVRWRRPIVCWYSALAVCAFVMAWADRVLVLGVGRAVTYGVGRPSDVTSHA